MGCCSLSTIGRKVLSAVTGLGLGLFVIVHLIGNLTLLLGPEAFNGYAHFLETLLHGAFIYLAEAGLLAFFLFHIWMGVSVWLRKSRARERGYEVSADAGGASYKTTASLSMILSGIALAVFVVLHLLHFKFGPDEAQGYVATAHGEPVRDLYRLVIEEFHKPVPTLAYVIFMLFLGLHLRHGFWSAFQSLGVGSPRLTPLIHAAGVALALLLAAGFLALPVYIYFGVELPASTHLQPLPHLP